MHLRCLMVSEERKLHKATKFSKESLCQGVNLAKV